MEMRHVLSRKQWVAYVAVSKAGSVGIITERLIDRVYGDDPDGGPEDANGALRSVIHKTNRHLKAHGVCIRGTSRGNQHIDNFYRLVRIEDAQG